MNEFFYKLLQEPHFAFWSAITIISIAGIVTPFVFSYHGERKRRQEENELISEMMNKGFTADEIEKILLAKNQKQERVVIGNQFHSTSET